MVAIIAVGSSCASYHINKGNRYYESIGYSKAIPHYEKAYASTSNPEIEIKLADSYYKTGKLAKAEEIYKKAIDRGDQSSRLFFDYGKVLMANGKHQEAAEYFKKYLQVRSSDPVALMLLGSCNSVIERYQDTSLFVLKPIVQDQFVNSFSIIEYRNGAIFTADKEVFSGRKTAAWTGNSYLDLYSMQKDSEGNWMEPEMLQGDINGRFHEGPACFTPDGNVVYFTRSNYFKRKMEVNEQDENNLKIFKATLIDGKWKNLEEFPYNSDD